MMEEPIKIEEPIKEEPSVKKEQSTKRKQERYAPAQTQPLRRVGSVTLGICLIGYGVLFLLHMLWNLSYTFIFQVWPALFILLGLEVLAGSFLHRNTKIRLDFFACIMIFLTICFAMCLGIMDYGIEHHLLYMW